MEQDNRPTVKLVRLTEQEIDAVRAMFDIALQARGRAVVQIFNVLDAKFAQALSIRLPKGEPSDDKSQGNRHAELSAEAGQQAALDKGEAEKQRQPIPGHRDKAPRK